MRNKRLLFSAVAVAAFMSGCANLSGWQPTVDAYNDPNAGNLTYDMNECKALAKQAAAPVREIAMGAGAGGLIGGAGGAVAGAFAGNQALGAGIGAAGLGFLGGTVQGIRSDENYKSAYKQCMRGRGYRVL